MSIRPSPFANKIIERTTDKTILVPGHGQVGNRAQLIEFRDMLVAVRDKVAALKSQGKSLEEVIAAKPTAAFDDEMGEICDRSGILHKACVRRAIDSVGALPPPANGVPSCLMPRTSFAAIQYRPRSPAHVMPGVRSPIRRPVSRCG